MGYVTLLLQKAALSTLNLNKRKIMLYLTAVFSMSGLGQVRILQRYCNLLIISGRLSSAFCQPILHSQVASLNGYGERLLSLLEDASARTSGSADQCSSADKCEEESEEGRKTLHSLCKKLSEDVSRKVCVFFRLQCMEHISIYYILTKTEVSNLESSPPAQ